LEFLRESPDYEFVDWNFKGSTQEEFNYLCNAIHAEGKEIYISDYMHLGMYGCRIIVPDMSEIYHPEDLEWDNNNAGIKYREAIFNLPSLNLEQLSELLTNLINEGFDDQHPIAALLGLAPDKDSKWATLRMGELKTRLALAIGDNDNILQGCDWIKYNGQLTPKEAQLYLCIESLLQLGESDLYLNSLNSLYGANVVHKAKEWLSGNNIFSDLSVPTLNLNDCELHQKLLQAYTKLQTAMKIAEK